MEDVMKVCSKCGIEKDESEFGKRKNRVSGVQSLCLICNRERVKNHRLNNIDNYKIKEKKQYEKTGKQYAKEHYLNNKKKYNIKSKEWYELNKNKCIERNNINSKIRRDNNPSEKLKCNIRKNFLYSLKYKGINKRKSFWGYTGIAYADYIAYFENNFPAEFAEITVKGKYHIDHIIPCAVYDFNNAEHIKLCWQPENLRIIPAKENLEKNDKLDFKLIEKHGISHLLPKGIKI